MKRREAGSAVVELALILSVITLLLLGVVDFAFLIQASLVVADAAHAGAQYGAVDGNGADLVGMSNAASAAAGGIANFTAASNFWCTCTPQGTTVNCSTTVCATYVQPIRYVRVNTSANVPLLFGLNGFAPSITVTGSSTLRVQ